MRGNWLTSSGALVKVKLWVAILGFDSQRLTDSLIRLLAQTKRTVLANDDWDNFNFIFRIALKLIKRYSGSNGLAPQIEPGWRRASDGGNPWQ